MQAMKEVSTKTENLTTFCEIKRKELAKNDAGSIKQGAVSDSKKAEADELARKLLENRREMSDISFTGSYEVHKANADKYFNLESQYNDEANRKQNQISRITDPEEKKKVQKEIADLRDKAKKAREKINQEQSYMGEALNSMIRRY